MHTHPSIHPSIFRPSPPTWFPHENADSVRARDDHLTLITRPSKSTMDPRGVDRSVIKGKIESKKAIKNRRILPVFIISSFLLSSLPLSPLLLAYTICLSIYLSTCPSPSLSLPPVLFLFLSLRLPFRWPFGPLHRPSIKVPSTAHRCVRVYVCVRCTCVMCVYIRENTAFICVYTTRQDLSLVRSHFKHLLYHDRSLGRPVRFLARASPSSYGGKERPVVTRNETSMVPRHELKTHSRRTTRPAARLLPLLLPRRFHVHIPLGICRYYTRFGGVCVAPAIGRQAFRVVSEIRRIATNISHK